MDLMSMHNKRPADVLAANWMLGKPAAFDFTVTSPLVSTNLPEASVTAVEERKHIGQMMPNVLNLVGCPSRLQ